jgi:hypothetical protein
VTLLGYAADTSQGFRLMGITPRRHKRSQQSIADLFLWSHRREAGSGSHGRFATAGDRCVTPDTGSRNLESFKPGPDAASAAFLLNKFLPLFSPGNLLSSSPPILLLLAPIPGSSAGCGEGRRRRTNAMQWRTSTRRVTIKSSKRAENRCGTPVALLYVVPW